LEPTYRSGIEYQFNNAVVHNTWYFDTVCIYILVGRMGGMGGRTGGGRPLILPLLPVLALPRDGTMLRCQINRLNKTDPKEPYRVGLWPGP
jgi:hypothetical protein